MRAYERFLQYAVIHTRSDDASAAVPSTARQFDLARLLAEQLRTLGAADAAVDGHCYVYGSLPATPGREHVPPLGFIAHMDTADYEAACVRPVLHPHYDGGDVPLEGRVLSPSMFPHLRDLRGQTLITASGDTLLGADDKAGIAEIMTMLQRLQSGRLPHGRICVAFTPDEEIGRGADHFDLERFGAQYAYTVDGGAAGEIEYENFNACSAVFTFSGVDVHPGSAKGVMINALLLAMEANAMLPAAETPRHTERYEGFFHLTQIQGTVEHASLQFIIRDHDGGHFEARQEMLRQIEKAVNEKYGAGTAKLTISQQYRNMEEMVKPCMHLIDCAKESIRELGMEPDVSPVRGGTDGAQLSFRGLPCPNLGTGGYAFHGPYEHITAEGMDLVVQVMLGIVKRYANREK